jgi:FixJ family two-component response regulator
MPNTMPTIVVVEDDASMSQAIERILRAGGFAAALFASAEAALEAGAAALADCLVLDIHLPGMSGFELYRRLALAGKELPAVFITAHDEPAVREEAERLGGAGSYLPKPFSGRDLLGAVARALRCH